MLEETTSIHLVMPEDLNPHGTLFAGQLAKWVVIDGVATASRLTGQPESVLLVKLDMNLNRPIQNGHLSVIKSRIAYLGKTSITVNSRVFDNDGKEPSSSGMTVFATVDKKGKPYRHGYVLPADYIKNNHDIYEAALKIRK